MNESFCMESLRQMGCAFLSVIFFSFFRMALNSLNVKTQSLWTPCWKLGGRLFLTSLIDFFSHSRLALGRISDLASSNWCRNQTSFSISIRNRHRISSETMASSVLTYFLQLTVDIVLMTSVSKGYTQLRKSAQHSLSLQPYTEKRRRISYSCTGRSLSSMNQQMCWRLSSCSPMHKWLNNFWGLNSCLSVSCSLIACSWFQKFPSTLTISHNAMAISCPWSLPSVLINDLFIIYNHTTVMAETRTKDGKYSADNCLAVLAFENSLLKDRNKVLAAENQSLLHRINILSDRQIPSEENSNPNIPKSDTHRQISSLSNLLSSFSSYLVRQNPGHREAPTQCLHSMLQNGCPTYSILDCLSELLDKESVQGQARRKTDFQKITESLRDRKERFAKRQKIKSQFLHVIKQPFCNQDKHAAFGNHSQSEFVLQYCEKLLLSTSPLSGQLSKKEYAEIFSNLRRMCRLRSEMRDLGRQLAKLEREHQLGVACSVAVCEVSGKLGECQREYSELMEKNEGVRGRV